MYVVGLDGGGTKTSVAIADETGRIVHTFVAGAINLNGNDEREVAATVAHIFSTIASVCGGDLHACLHVCIGAAGMSNPSAREKLMRCVQESGYRGGLTIVGDHETALYGAHGTPCGMILIAGTGSICFGANAKGETHRTGGFGHLVDDEGSGYWIGKQLLAATLQASDGRIPATLITELVYERLGLQSVRQLIGYVYDKQRSKKDIAALAPLLITACAHGDLQALKIARESGDALARLVVPVAAKLELDEGPLALAGGVLTHHDAVRGELEQSLQRRYPNMSCYYAKQDAMHGAVSMAIHRLNMGKRGRQ